jgi:hypothetical protein
MNSQKIAKINLRDCGYKSIHILTVGVTYHYETVKSDFAVELLGDTVEIVRIDRLDIAAIDQVLLNDEMIQMGYKLDLWERHVKDLLRDKLLGFSKSSVVKFN